VKTGSLTLIVYLMQSISAYTYCPYFLIDVGRNRCTSCTRNAAVTVVNFIVTRATLT